MTVAHPNDIVTDSLSDDDTRVMFLPLEGMNHLLEKFPYYRRATIPISLYPRALNDDDIDTVGLWATLLTTEDVDDDAVRLSLRYSLLYLQVGDLKLISKPNTAINHRLWHHV